MKYQVLLAVLLFNLTAFSQYLKIPTDSNYFWKQQSVTSPSLSNCSYHYQIRYKKDTVINSKTYNKYSTFGAVTGNSVSACSPYHVKNGYLRQDTLAKKVFILDNNFVERPLYNFTKMIGDTMQMYQFNLNATITVTITMRDSTIFGDGKYHRRQWAINSTYGNSIYEGMGCVSGGLYAHNSGGYVPNTEGFTCFGKITPFTHYFGGSPSSCVLNYVGLKENTSTGGNFKAFPNPAQENLFVTSENMDLNMIKLDLTNSLGQSIRFHSETIDTQIICKIEELPPGIYFLKIYSKTELETIRFIKR